jgi:zinc-binding alcohol dehydrogenase/oxidoreductase
MYAWVLNGTEVLPTLQYLEDPKPGSENQKLVRIVNSSLNHRDIWICKGQYPGIILPCVLGSDGCGYYDHEAVIINPGKSWGDNQEVQSEHFHITGMPSQGTFADYIVADKNQIYKLPDHLSSEEGAAIPLAGVTAFRAFIIKCKPNKASKVLVTGIGGGVSLWVLQYALALGCEVFVTSRHQEKINRAVSLGAAGGVVTSKADWSKNLQKMSGGFDIIIDSIMGNTLQELIKLCRPGARFCFYGASGGKTDNFAPHSIFWRQISIFGSTMGSDHDFNEMMNFISEYSLKPVIDTVFPFSKLPDAMERMKSAEQFGKIILDHSK